MYPSANKRTYAHTYTHENTCIKVDNHSGIRRLHRNVTDACVRW